VTPQFIDRALSQATIVPERVNGDIDADLVPRDRRPPIYGQPDLTRVLRP
jgi:hypothetical protein